MEKFVVKESRNYECAEDVTDKVLQVWLKTNDKDKPSGYLEIGKDYNTDGRMLTIINPEIKNGDEIWIHTLPGRLFAEDEYRNLLCDPKTWYYKSDGLYCAADVIISLYYRDIVLYKNGIIQTPEPKFWLSMLDPWLLLMALAIENAAKGIIVCSEIKKDPSLKERATLELLNIKGHHIDKYLRRAFKAKNAKPEFMELRLVEDLAAYAEFAGKYQVGTTPKASIPHDIIMQSTPAECFELGYFDTIISLYKKIYDWLSADVEEAHAEEHERFRETVNRLEEKWGNPSHSINKSL
ncbi:MAG: hypothetical protein ACYDHX_04015 [Methanothrix sp.]